MVFDTTTVEPANETADETEKELPRYLVDLEEAGNKNRSLSTLIASRGCYTCRQADDEQPPASSEPQQYVDRIVDHCSETPDYLPPDTPLKEAIFRVLLAGGNEPADAQEIGLVLSDKWSLTPYPRDLSARVVQRLLDNSESYFIARVRVPVVEEEEETAEPVDEAVEEQTAADTVEEQEEEEPEADTAEEQQEAANPEEGTESGSPSEDTEQTSS